MYYILKMSLFTCSNCSREFRRKDYLQKHNKRKNPCKRVENENDTKMIPNDTSKNEIKFKKIYTCKFCEQEFKNKRSLYRHINEIRCTKIPDKEIKRIKAFRNNKILNKKIEKEKELVLVNNKTITNNSHKNNNNKININQLNNNIININPFGKENLESITEKEKIRILNRAFMAFPEALKKIHYDIPENRNFFNTDKKNKKYIQVFNGTNLIYEDKDKIQDDISYKIMGKLEEWFDDYQRQFNTRRKDLLSRMFNEFNNGRLEDKYENEIDKFILSYSNDMKEILQKQIEKIKNG